MVGTLIIRADAGGRTGTGHVMRMLALAQAWRRREGRAIFLCGTIPESLERRVGGAGFEVVTDDDCSDQGSVRDAARSVTLAEENGGGAVVCDGYGFGEEYQTALRRAGLRLMVVADYAVGSGFDCDYLLNQNPGFSGADYPGLGGGGRLLAGTTFALLREDVLAAREREEIAGDAGSGCRVLVTFGGTDPDNTTGRVVAALGAIAGPEGWDVRVVVGGANEARGEIESLGESFEAVEVVVDPPDMGGHMSWADVAVTAGGSTCWELCYFGVPMVLISIAGNQDPIVEGLGKLGAGIDLGWHERIEEAVLVGELRALTGDAERRLAMGDAARRLVDGRGADRVAAALGGALKISIATAGEGWVADLLESFLGRLREMGHEVVLVTEGAELPEGDVAFFLSFWSLVPAGVLKRNCHNLVVHASALPEGKGWSPLTWKILEGKRQVPLTLFEAEAKVDSGVIYLQEEMVFEGHELLPELREKLMATTFDLCERFVRGYPAICGEGVAQSGDENFYRRRGPEDSRLDPERSIAEQFDLLRTVDNERYPAFFDFRGQRYRLQIDKMP